MTGFNQGITLEDFLSSQDPISPMFISSIQINSEGSREYLVSKNQTPELKGWIYVHPIEGKRILERVCIPIKSHETDCSIAPCKKYPCSKNLIAKPETSYTT